LGDPNTNGHRPGIASDGDGFGLTADEFLSSAEALLCNGHHPLAIGRKHDDDKPAGKAPWHSPVTGYDGIDAEADQVAKWLDTPRKYLA